MGLTRSFTGLSNPGSDCPMTTLHGKSYIEEKLFDLTFHVSPYAFFQVNTPVAEILYRNIGDWVSLHENTLLLDVCCGTGTIGLCLANRVKYVIGVDIEASAIEDAKRNAELNGITNCEFICSPAEKVMSDLLRREDMKRRVALVILRRRIRPHCDDRGSSSQRSPQGHSDGESEVRRDYGADLRVVQPNGLLHREHG
mgnify:FL=1